MSDPIAIVGMAARLPGADNLAAVRAALRSGKDQLTDLSAKALAKAGVPPERIDSPDYVRRAPVLDDIAGFDRDYFGLPKSQAEVMDPQHRIFMECAVEALEDACITSDHGDLHIGVFASASISSYLLFNVLPGLSPGASAQTLMAMAGNDKDYLASHTAYLLGLRGPAVGIQTACSSSLVGVHYAMRSLADGECDVALAGGVTIRTPHRVGYEYEAGSILSPTGACRSFDAGADGTVFGSGAGVVALARLSTARSHGWPVYAVLQGSAVNNDGSDKAGYTAPGLDGQTAVISEAMAASGLGPDDIGYIEGHGTGTPIGDPMEVRALTAVFADRNAALPRVALGSAKATFGHLEAASGVVGLISASVAISDRTVPALAHFQTPNPHFRLDQTPFSLSGDARPWPDDLPRRAGVSSFGIGGTNAHVILGIAPDGPIKETTPPETALIYSVTAHTEAALAAAIARHADHLKHLPALSAAARTAVRGRKLHQFRAAVVAKSPAQATDALSVLQHRTQPAGDIRVGFVYSGQGGRSWPDIAALRKRFTPFRKQMDDAAACLPDLSDIFSGKRAPDPADTAALQPSLFALQAAVTRTLADFGIAPACVTGHSVGEIAAAWSAGMIGFEDALTFSQARGALMVRQTGGAMASIAASSQGVAPHLAENVTIAARNSRHSTVVTGPEAGVAKTIANCVDQGIPATRLAGSVAFHSAGMQDCSDDLTKAAVPMTTFDADRPFVSTLTGARLDTLPPDHWVTHAVQPVAFQKAIATMTAEGVTNLIEIGPGAGLSAMLRQSDDAPHCVPCLGGQGDETALLAAVAELFTIGCDVDLSAGFESGPMARLPTYPFQRKPHWVEPAPKAAAGLARASLWPDRPDWLADHHVDQRPVMPAAGFAAFLMAATARRDLGPTRFKAMLEIDTSGVELSVSQQDGTVTVLAAAPGETPQPYASTQTGVPVAEWVVEKGEAPNNTLDAAKFYDSLKGDGIALGPSLRRLGNIRRGGNCASADIRMDSTAGHGFGAPVHPAILDAMFQVLAAAAGQASDVPHVPVAFSALRVHGDLPPDGTCFCQAVLRDKDIDAADDLIGDIALFGSDDKVLVQVTGLTSKPVALTGQSMLYAPVWIEDPQPHLATPAQVVADLAIPKPDADRVTQYLDGIDRLAALFMAQALRQLAGLPLPSAQAALYERLLARYSDYLRTEGLVDAQGNPLDPQEDPTTLADQLARDFPDHALETGLLQHCGPALADILSDKLDPVAHLFSDGLARLGALYGEAALARMLNTCIAEALYASAKGQSGLRILELGGGTGGSTAHVLPKLQSQLTEYRFTDLSSGFFPDIQARFADILGFSTDVLNIEKPFADQGIADIPYDIILASNVLHAAGDLRAAVRHAAQALKPGGWLALIEGFTPSRWLDVTFALTSGWWSQDDRDLRPDYPLLPPEAWRRLLAEEGFDAVEIVTLGPDRLAEQGIVLARRAQGMPPEVIDVSTSIDPLEEGLARLQHVPSEGLCVVATRGASQVRPHEVPDPRQASVTGLVKTALQEDRSRPMRVVDLPRDHPGDALTREAAIADVERYTTWRDGRRLLERLEPVRPPAQLPARFAVDVQDGDLRFSACAVPDLDRDQVEIEIRAAGLNFKDVLTVLGVVPPAGGLGSDVAGIITRIGPGVTDLQPGQRVVALSAGAFASHVTVPRMRVVALDDRTSFAEAAALPVAGTTAVHVMSEVLSLAPGDRILIHTATGAVGHFAVQLARAAGAEIFATAGSDWKRSYLKSLGVAHVFDSRSTDFAKDIRRIAPDGLDAVINTLTGDAIEAGLDLLRPGGHFVELGRHDIRTAEAVSHSHPELSYSIVSLDQIDDATSGRLLATTLDRLGTGDIAVPPLTVMPMARLRDAIDLMKRGGHLGKIVLRHDPLFEFRADRAYLITGAMGGIGMALAQAAVEAGAGALHLTAHRPLSETQDRVVAALKGTGTRVHLHQVDLADAAEVDLLLDAVLASNLPLVGLFHAAGRLDDAVLGDLTPARMDHVAGPKLTAAQRFDARLGDLDAFVLFSSAAGGLGSPGQGNHAAAATALDAIAEARHARGLRALAIDWGAWGEIGAAHARGADTRAADQGISTIAPKAGLKALFDAIASGLPRIFALPLDPDKLARQDPATRNPIFERLLPDTFDPSTGSALQPTNSTNAAHADLYDLDELPPKQRRHRIAAMVETHARRLMNLGAEDLSHLRPLQELGLDSLMSIELRNQLGRMTGQSLPTTLLFNHPTVESLANYLTELIWPETPVPTVPRQTQPAAETDEDVLYLDDAELERILSDMEDKYG